VTVVCTPIVSSTAAEGTDCPGVPVQVWEQGQGFQGGLDEGGMGRQNIGRGGGGVRGWMLMITLW